MNLFMDTTNGHLIYLLEKDNKIVGQLMRHDIHKISDYALDDLKTLLTEHQLTLPQIKKLYLVNGPGSYLGIRVGLTIASTLKTLNPDLEIFVINSLFYQVGLKTTLSVIDARGDKLYVAIYDKGKEKAKPKVLLKNDYEKWALPWLNQGYVVIKDYEDLNYAENFLNLKEKFKPVNHQNQLKPLYVKGYLQ